MAAALFAHGETFHTDKKFSITLPDDWIEIPKNVLDAYSDNVAKLSPDTPKQIYDYGYQLRGSEKWLDYPYILVQVKNTGRVPSGELSRYKKLKAGFKKGLEQLGEDLSKIMSDTTIGEPFYDKENTMLWMSMSAEVRDSGTVKALIGVKLTEKGVIQLNGYSQQENFAKYKDVYTKAFSSLAVNDSIKYRPQITDAAPVIGSINMGEVLTSGIKSALIGGVIGLIILIKKKMKK